MKCVNTVSFSIDINVNYSIRFYPSRDIKQGYLLSPNFFILYVDLLSGLVIDGQVRGTIKCLAIAKNALDISHLLFANDSLIFCKAREEEVEELHNTFNKYQIAYGLLINYDKSITMFNNKVPNSSKEKIKKVDAAGVYNWYWKVSRDAY